MCRELKDGAHQDGENTSPSTEIGINSITSGAGRWGGKVAGSLESLEGRLTFGAGMVLGGIAGALVTYMSSYHRH